MIECARDGDKNIEGTNRFMIGYQLRGHFEQLVESGFAIDAHKLQKGFQNFHALVGSAECVGCLRS